MHWLVEIGSSVVRSEGFKIVVASAVACLVSIMKAETEAKCRQAGDK